MKLFITALFFIFNSFTINLLNEWSAWNQRNREEFWNSFKPESSEKEANSTTRSRDKKPAEDKIMFDSVVGGVVDEIKEIKYFIENPSMFDDFGVEKPTGILLVGPPGTGKTMMVKALANEVDAEFIFASASSFIELYVGTGPKAVKDLFEKARNSKKRHSIIFIDEIDSIGSRSISMGSGAISEENKTINELLVQMDGFNKSANITVIAATNRPEMLDEALLRPGRFDYIVNVPLPDDAKRKALLNHYLHSKPRKIDNSVSSGLDQLVKETAGFNCAQMKEVVNRGSMIALRSKKKSLTLEDLSKAVKELR